MMNMDISDEQRKTFKEQGFAVGIGKAKHFSNLKVGDKVQIKNADNDNKRIGEILIVKNNDYLVEFHDGEEEKRYFHRRNLRKILR